MNGAAVTSADGSGFYANNQPAVLDANLLIQYGQVVPVAAPEAVQAEAAAIVAQTIVPAPKLPFANPPSPRKADETAEVVDNTKARPGECR